MNAAINASIDFTPNGLKFSRARRPVPMRGGGRRGKVTGFSRAAARRLRETLFRADFHPPGMGVLGVCLTLPREATAGVGTLVFERICKHSGRIPGLVAAVWRKEVQRNGRPHFHLVVWGSDSHSLRTVGALVRTWCRLVAARCEHPERVERKMLTAHCAGNETLFDNTSSALSLAELATFIPCLTPIDPQGRGVNYLIGHGSRQKRFQAGTQGRAWGVWNRKKLPLIPPDASQTGVLNRSDEVALARVLRRLFRYPIPASCVFRRRLHRGRRFDFGSHIIPSITTGETVRRWMTSQGRGFPLNKIGT